MYLVGLEWGGGAAKLFSVQFRPDGSIFVHFPYQPEAQGIAARLQVPNTPSRVETAPSGTVSKWDLDLTAEGWATLNKVKYVHHRDGRCHFSQDGRSLTEIKNQSFPLGNLPHPHVFTVEVEGVEWFEEVSPRRPVKGKYHYLRFVTKRNDPPRRVRVVARWGEVNRGQFVESISNPVSLESESDAPVLGLAIAPPLETPYPNHFLHLELRMEEATLQVQKRTDFMLLLTGGFGEFLEGRSTRASLLALIYPAELKIQLPSLDLPGA